MKAVLLTIDEPKPPARTPDGGFALWALGFRPFYLAAAAFAALSVPLWALQFAGWLPRPYLPAALWHAHEMVFGFALAVIVGFLLTAGRNWTGHPTPTGTPLAALVALWLCARAAVLSPWPWVALVLNVAFPLAAALALWRTFRRADNRRNDFFVALLGLMALAAGVFHASAMGMLPDGGAPGARAVQAALDVVLFTIAVMAGRVVPMFTNNGVPGTQATRHPRIEQAALGSVLALLAVDALGIDGSAPWGPWLVGAVAAFGMAAHALRLARWQPLRTRRVPLVWVLHAAYAWIPVYLALRAAASLGFVAPSTAAHALTVGAIGGMIIGMITRTALGHTGRPLRAGRAETVCYALVLASAVVRVVPPLVWPTATMHAVLTSSLLWSAAFALYVITYAPKLVRARVDGKPG